MCDYPNMKSKDNIAYSVDTGSNYPSEENQIKLKEYSKNFKRISLRNIFKIEKIKTIIERPDTVITLDPTLLLEEDDYKPITQNINFKNYVLVYNCKENHSIMVEQAKTFAKKHNLKIKIINCYDKNCKNIFDGVPTLIGIEKFLGLIKNSSAFFTNSYHGICFATIFKKNFFGYSRTANNEKIETILNILGLEERFITDEAQLTLENINYDEVYEKIKPLKEFSKQWINDSIKQP